MTDAQLVQRRKMLTKMHNWTSACRTQIEKKKFTRTLLGELVNIKCI